MNEAKLLIIHGHNTNGNWMKLLKHQFKDASVEVDCFSFGRVIFGILPWHINDYAIGFNKWYHLNHANGGADPNRYPSIIAHSLGSYILLKAMEKDETIRFNKIYLFGSIIPRDYPFNLMIGKKQFDKIINYKIDFDAIAMCSFLITGKFYPSGVFGFTNKYVNSIEVKAPKGTHNDVKKFSIVNHVVTKF